MKTTVLMLAASAAWLTISPTQAADPAKTFGTFHAGDTFSLHVTERSSIRAKGDDAAKAAPVPAGVPNFSKGQKVKFTIGAQGQLKGSGFSIKFKGRVGFVNAYSNDPSWGSREGDAATVVKPERGAPSHATLNFFRFSFSGFIPVLNTVKYQLE